LLLNGNARLNLSKTHPIEDESSPDDDEKDEQEETQNQNENEDADGGKEADQSKGPSLLKEGSSIADDDNQSNWDASDEPVDQYQTPTDTAMAGIRLAGRMVNQVASEDPPHRSESQSPELSVPVMSQEVVHNFWAFDSDSDEGGEVRVAEPLHQEIAWEDDSSDESKDPFDDIDSY
jgi:hypothetical protein